MGVVTTGGRKSAWVQVRVDPVEKAAWWEAARGCGLSLTEFLERAVREYAAAELAARSEAGRLAADRERLRGRMFPAKP